MYDKLRIWTVPSDIKIRPETEQPHELNHKIDVSGAKSAHVNAQVCLRTDTLLDNVTLRLYDLKQATGEKFRSRDISWRLVVYVYCQSIPKDWEFRYEAEPGWWPDPLLDVASFSLKPDITQSIWISFYIPEETLPERSSNKRG